MQHLFVEGAMTGCPLYRRGVPFRVVYVSSGSTEQRSTYGDTVEPDKTKCQATGKMCSL